MELNSVTHCESEVIGAETGRGALAGPDTGSRERYKRCTPLSSGLSPSAAEERGGALFGPVPGAPDRYKRCTPLSTGLSQSFAERSVLGLNTSGEPTSTWRSRYRACLLGGSSGPARSIEDLAPKTGLNGAAGLGTLLLSDTLSAPLDPSSAYRLAALLGVEASRDGLSEPPPCPACVSALLACRCRPSHRY